ncbi:MAG: hypothetical protein WAZ18_00150 [Alphaproteobacteria bacterium]
MTSNRDAAGYHGSALKGLDRLSDEVYERFQAMPEMTRDQHAEQFFWNWCSDARIERPEQSCTSFLISAIKQNINTPQCVLDEVKRQEPELYERNIKGLLE